MTVVYLTAVVTIIAAASSLVAFTASATSASRTPVSVSSAIGDAPGIGGSNSSQVVTMNFELRWQNEPGAPFSCTNCTTAYQFIDLELEVTSYRDFQVGTPVELFAYGTMSESLNFSGLQYVTLAYDNSTPYENTSGVFHVPYGLDLAVVANNTNIQEPMTYSVGSIVKLISEPVNVTWNSAGGPFYPRIDLHYYRGTEFNYKFTDAPVLITTGDGVAQAAKGSPVLYEIGIALALGIGAVVAIGFSRRMSKS